MHKVENKVNILFSDAGWSSLAARRAHNPKVVGSNPAPATKLIKAWRMRRAFFICAAIHLCCNFCAGESGRHQTHINAGLPDHHVWGPAIDDIDERSVHKVPGLIAMRDKHAPKQARRSR